MVRVSSPASSTSSTLISGVVVVLLVIFSCGGWRWNFLVATAPFFCFFAEGSLGLGVPAGETGGFVVYHPGVKVFREQATIERAAGGQRRTPLLR